MKFIHALFESYYDGQVKTYEIDGADVMKYEWPLTAGYKPILEGTDKVFTLPESKTGTDIFTSHFFITRRSFDACRKKINLTRTGLAAYILARVLQTENPGNTLPIRIRCPIDTRDILGVPHTFQNASVPHIFLEFKAEQLLPILPPEEINRIHDEFSRQRSYDHVAYMTNVIAAANKADSAEFYKVIKDYMRKSEFCVSYIGKAASKVMSEALIDMEPAFVGRPAFPVFLYFLELGEKIAIRYEQGFIGENYAAAIKKTFEQLEIEIV